MRKIVAAINMTLDGFCDHTAGMPDEELHQHYTELLDQGDAILYGRTTYQLMEYWRTLLENPAGNKAMDDFAVSIDTISKIVFSHTLKTLDWNTARLATQGIEEELSELRNQPGKDIFVGSPGLIVQCTRHNLIDEYQICIHPVIIGSGLPLFKDIRDKVDLKLLKTKTFGSGAIVLYYQPVKESKNN